MKRKIVIVALAVALVSAFAVQGFARSHHREQHLEGRKCTLCNGRGFVGSSPFPCNWCKGTGVNNSY